ncbi:hypothetical protein L1987_80614 [Smallanthus sonchifolius]|uniref:Uncharacterized protein n=1 Tax=Smallanthus sonchifolius TaxID=185202 RepID=A0ACB8YMF3_9ASTR|nr:hypothetical protein L1987_80614 [Smallanthus sonchifolius]
MFRLLLCSASHHRTINSQRRLTDHSHVVQDVVLSSDGRFVLSGSWDGEIRLYDLNAGTIARRFVGHTKDVLSVAFSIDNRHIVSASHDKSIKLWNTFGEKKNKFLEWVKYDDEKNEYVLSNMLAVPEEKYLYDRWRSV